MNKDLEQAKALLENNEEYTCAACRAGRALPPRSTASAR